MRERYIPSFIVLLAGAVTSIFNIVYKVEMITALKRLLIVLIIFYVIGTCVKGIYKVAVIKYAKKPETQENVAMADKSDMTEENQDDKLKQGETAKQGEVSK